MCMEAPLWAGPPAGIAYTVLVLGIVPVHVGTTLPLVSVSVQEDTGMFPLSVRSTRLEVSRDLRNSSFAL